MNTHKYQIVLQDDLLNAYYQFKQGNAYDTMLISRLLTYYKPHLTCVAQLRRIGMEDSALYQQLTASGWVNLNNEELAQQTSLKLILSSDQSDFPYVNILGFDSIEPNYTGTFKNKSRQKAIDHLKTLCQNAKSIYIYDPHLAKYQDRSNQAVMQGIFDLLPMRQILLFSEKDAFLQCTKSSWKKKNPQLTFKNSSIYKDMHDRYLIIDQKVEVILSSGFDYLFDESRDFTYVVRLLH
ncbi:MAG: hypothetical protein LBR60_02730 [Fibrobacter sp.]|jgi:hypothetical protein|nr:hypothetical protein [Fibrobacter sp.]